MWVTIEILEGSHKLVIELFVPSPTSKPHWSAKLFKLVIPERRMVCFPETGDQCVGVEDADLVNINHWLDWHSASALSAVAKRHLEVYKLSG